MRMFIQGKRGREKRGRSEFKLRRSPDRGSGDDRRLEERKLSERGSSLLGLGALYVRVGYIGYCFVLLWKRENNSKSRTSSLGGKGKILTGFYRPILIQVFSPNHRFMIVNILTFPDFPIRPNGSRRDTESCSSAVPHRLSVISDRPIIIGPIQIKPVMHESF